MPLLQVEGEEEEEGDGEPEATEPDFALIFYNLAVRLGPAFCEQLVTVGHRWAPIRSFKYHRLLYMS